MPHGPLGGVDDFTRVTCPAFTLDRNSLINPVFTEVQFNSNAYYFEYCPRPGPQPRRSLNRFNFPKNAPLVRGGIIVIALPNAIMAAFVVRMKNDYRRFYGRCTYILARAWTITIWSWSTIAGVCSGRCWMPTPKLASNNGVELCPEIL